MGLTRTGTKEYYGRRTSSPFKRKKFIPHPSQPYLAGPEERVEGEIRLRQGLGTRIPTPENARGLPTAQGFEKRSTRTRGAHGKSGTRAGYGAVHLRNEFVTHNDLPGRADDRKRNEIPTLENVPRTQWHRRGRDCKEQRSLAFARISGVTSLTLWYNSEFSSVSVWRT